MEITDEVGTGIRNGAESARRARHHGHRARKGREHKAVAQEAAKEWVRRHQDAAILAAFAAGVYIGYMMRG